MSVLSQKVLQLTAAYEPDRIIEVCHALALVYARGAAEVLAYDPIEKAHTPTKAYDIPTVIRLVRYYDTRRQRERSKKQRLAIFKRDNFRCQYCAKRFAPFELTVDHIIPKSRGGPEFDSRNLATACDPCNQRKGNRTPDEARMPLLASPSALRYGLDRAELRHEAEFRPEWQIYLPYIFPEAVTA